MSKIAIVTDSTANLPRNIVEQFGIHVVPQVLIWDGETYEDGVDIHPKEFYERLKGAKIMPSTSQVTPKSFLEIYEKLLTEGYEVLSILIAEKLSGTISSALQAKAAFPNAPIEIVDSGTTSLALGFVVLHAAEALSKGADLKQAHLAAENARQKVGVVFAVDTLEFLHRGGRIGGGTRFMGTALNIKPILEVVDGHVEGVEKVRTRSKSITRLIELVHERVGTSHPVRIAALHANAHSDALNLLAQASNQIETTQAILGEVSPVIGTHAGPGTVGLAWMAGIE